MIFGLPSPLKGLRPPSMPCYYAPTDMRLFRSTRTATRALRPLRSLLGAMFSLTILLATTQRLSPIAHAQLAPACQFILGFKALHDLDPVDIGDCVDNQAFAANGDAQQHTTKGLMAWRKLDNWTAFTNGSQTWINGPAGLVRRGNTQRFDWEANPDGLQVIDSTGRVLSQAVPNPTIGMSRESRASYWSTNANVTNFGPNEADIRAAIQQSILNMPDSPLGMDYVSPQFAAYFRSQWTSQFPYITIEDVIGGIGNYSDLFLTGTISYNASNPAEASWNPSSSSADVMFSDYDFRPTNYWLPDQKATILQAGIVKEKLASKILQIVMIKHKQAHPSATPTELNAFQTKYGVFMAENVSVAMQLTYDTKFFPEQTPPTPLRGQVLQTRVDAEMDPNCCVGTQTVAKPYTGPLRLVSIIADIDKAA